MILKIRDVNGWHWIDHVDAVGSMGDKARHGLKAGSDTELCSQLRSREGVVHGNIELFGKPNVHQPDSQGFEVFVQVVRYLRRGQWNTAVLHLPGYLLNDSGDTIASLA